MVMKRYAYSELHISTAAGFTPSAATLKATSKSGSFNVTDLTPGTTYYYRVIHRDLRGLVGQATPEQSFVAGYTRLPHMDPAVTQTGQAVLGASSNVAMGGVSDTLTMIVPLDQATLLRGMTFDPATGKLTTQYDGSFLVSANLTLFGAAPGDSIRLAIHAALGGVGDVEVSAAPMATVVHYVGTDFISVQLTDVLPSLPAGTQIWLYLVISQPAAAVESITILGGSPYSSTRLSLTQLFSQ